jgi:hypothetical protein
MGLNVDRVLSEYEEDTAASGGETGQYVLAVVQDTLASSAGDGDFGSIKTNLKGELYTHDADAIALLTTIDTDTGAIATSVASIDTDTSTIAGDTTSMDATLTALSITEDSAGGGGGNEGIAMLAERSDAGGTLVSADGDMTNLSVDSTGNLRVAASFSVPNASIDQQAVTVGTSEVALPTTAEPGRDSIIIQNLGTSSIFVGKTGVTTSTGLEISKRSSLELSLGPSVTVFGISGAAGQDVRVFETA